MSTKTNAAGHTVWTKAMEAELNRLLGLKKAAEKSKKKPRKKSEREDGPRSLFSCTKASEGGESFKDAKDRLEGAGVKDVRRGPQSIRRAIRYQRSRAVQTTDGWHTVRLTG